MGTPPNFIPNEVDQNGQRSWKIEDLSKKQPEEGLNNSRSIVLRDASP
jgi:hypothetical protein